MSEHIPTAPQTEREPLAWRFELATHRIWTDGNPTGWGGWEWRLSDSAPNAGDAMRNVTPLYAAPSDLEITKAEIMAIGDTVTTLRKIKDREPRHITIEDDAPVPQSSEAPRAWLEAKAEVDAGWPACSSEATIQARREAYEDAAKICERIEINAERRGACHLPQSAAQEAAYNKAEAASQCKHAIRERIEGLTAHGAKLGSGS